MFSPAASRRASARATNFMVEVCNIKTRELLGADRSRILRNIKLDQNQSGKATSRGKGQTKRIIPTNDPVGLGEIYLRDS